MCLLFHKSYISDGNGLGMIIIHSRTPREAMDKCSRGKPRMKRLCVLKGKERMLRAGALTPMLGDVEQGNDKRE